MSDIYPPSTNIDNTRVASLNVQLIPTITVAPSVDNTDMRVGRMTNASFTVTNNSVQAIDLGQLAIAVRDPDGFNADMPLVSAGTINPASSYTYSQSFTPKKTGVYSGFVTDTKDNGKTWNEVNFHSLLIHISFLENSITY